MLKNNNRMLKPPMKEPINNCVNLTFLLSIKDTERSSIKSRVKFNIIIKSKYIFIISP